MKIIDLSLQISNGKKFYATDPEISLEKIATLEKDGWNVTQIKFCTHDATHVNVPIHAKIGGKTLDDYSIEDFIGEAVLFENIQDIQPGIGIIFSQYDITMEMAKKIIETKPKFVGLSNMFEFDLDVEKYLVEHDIISFERLVNTDKLPKKFIFHAVPLKIEKGDGSPVRAYAII